MAHWHDFNPWANSIVYIPSLEELAECVAGGTIHILAENKTVPYNVDYLVEHWQNEARIMGTPNKLDAYILPQPNGDHSVGVRYGKEASEYFSPMNRNKEKTQELLNKYKGRP